jgi:hypothetical protein
MEDLKEFLKINMLVQQVAVSVWVDRKVKGMIL